MLYMAAKVTKGREGGGFSLISDPLMVVALSVSYLMVKYGSHIFLVTPLHGEAMGNLSLVLEPKPSLLASFKSTMILI